MKKKCSDAEFWAAWETDGAPEVQRLFGLGDRNARKRRRRLEDLYDKPLSVKRNVEHPQRIEISVPQGSVVVASDAHYWPGSITTAHKGLLHVLTAVKPAAVILNGDMCDFGQIGRHPRIGWEHQPTVIDEMQTVQLRLAEIVDCAPNAARIWNLGNHDARFEARLAAVAPEYENVSGLHLKDHFPAWSPSWSTWINGSVVVKHRFRSGVGAAHSNALWAGKSIVTGHTHHLLVTPFSDYNGTRFGVEGGTLAEPYGEQFRDYTEDNPSNTLPGFVVLHFHDGMLLWPEVVRVLRPGFIEFRHQIVEVG